MGTSRGRCVPAGYPVLSLILLYNKEALSHALLSLSASASRFGAAGADTNLYTFTI